MDHFQLCDGVLHCEDVPLPEIAAAVGTPVYVYSTATMQRHARVFREAVAGCGGEPLAAGPGASEIGCAIAFRPARHG